jgi:hypothetical protein
LHLGDKQSIGFATATTAQTAYVDGLDIVSLSENTPLTGSAIYFTIWSTLGMDCNFRMPPETLILGVFDTNRLVQSEDLSVSELVTVFPMENNPAAVWRNVVAVFFIGKQDAIGHWATMRVHDNGQVGL